MATIIKTVISGYNYLMEEAADPRVKDWFMMGSPWTMIAIVLLYHYFVRNWAPQYMATRKAFNLDRIMQIYNMVQVIICIYLVYQGLSLGWLNDYSWTCQPVDYSTSPRAIAVARSVWLYYLVKVSDLVDTVFFVLRKKQSQVSFLHLYHHTGMVIGSWIVAKFIPGGHVTFLGTLNSFVHVIMYTYYLASSLKVANPVFKKYITQLQLTQFILIVVHFAQLFWVPSCGFPMWPAVILIPQNLFMFVLFSDFYYKSYIKKSPAKQKPKLESTKTQ